MLLNTARGKVSNRYPVVDSKLLVVSCTRKFYLRSARNPTQTRKKIVNSKPDIFQSKIFKPEPEMTEK